MAVSHPDSVEKLFKQLAVVARVPFEAQGKRYEPPVKFVISETFWRRYGCHLQCGGCCPAFTLDWTPHEWFAFNEASGKANEPYVVQREVVVDGNPVPLFTIQPSKQFSQHRWGKDWCGFVELGDGGCTIHEHNPLSCRIELLKFVSRKTKGEQVGYLYKGPFGRAAQMMRVVDGVKDVLCTIDEGFDEPQFTTNDIPVLKQMLKWAQYLGIDTHLAEVIPMLDMMAEQQRFERLEWSNHAAAV